MNKEIEKLNNKIKKFDSSVDDRVKLAFDKFEKLLNPNNQQNMIMLNDIIHENWSVNGDLIMQELEKRKYLEVFEIVYDTRIVIPKEPYSDIYLKMEKDYQTQSFRIAEEIVVSKEVEEFIHKFCEEKMKGGN